MKQLRTEDQKLLLNINANRIKNKDSCVVSHAFTSKKEGFHSQEYKPKEGFRSQVKFEQRKNESNYYYFGKHMPAHNTATYITDTGEVREIRWLPPPIPR
ncbi:hypothetical protein RJT34_07940 [Clitoria ternatea]|uniref:Uncharacterized protein n=1 Tax=Clitoria ternatea TaxID=43366 RepID=A0AAN9K5X1_CLITE